MAQNDNSLYNFVYGTQAQFPQLQLPRSNASHQSFYNFVYGHDQAQFPQISYGSRENPIDVDELHFPEYVVNNFDLNMLPSPENMSPVPEDLLSPETDEVQEVIEISDDDSDTEPDNNLYQIQHQESSAIIYYKTWQHYHSPVHDWGVIVPFSEGPTLASKTPVPYTSALPSYTSTPYQLSTLSSTMAQFTTGETTTEYGMEVSSQPNLLNFTNYLRIF